MANMTPFKVPCRVLVVRVLALLVVCLGPLATAGCTVVLISSYDQATDQGVTALQRSVDGVMTKLEQNPTPDYATMKADYDGIRADLAVLHVRNEARDKNQLTVEQLDHLKTAIDDVESRHKKGTFVAVMAGPARDALDIIFVSILKLELAKKELKAS